VHDVAKVGPHRVLGDDELAGHGLVGVALSKEVKDLQLAAGEAGALKRSDAPLPVLAGEPDREGGG
jgi:hypothetical protein